MTLPFWLAALRDAVEQPAAGHWMPATAADVTGDRPPRRSAVLVLFGNGAHGPDVLLIERSPHLRSHAGQPAFPGGGIDAGDDGPVAAALREAREETGLDPAGVEVFAVLPDLFVPPSGNVVTPVLGWWRQASEVSVNDTREVAAVARVPIAELVDPAHRFVLRAPSGRLTPAFDVAGMTVWGFTAGVLDRLLALGGWEQPWDREREGKLPPDRLAMALRSRRYGDV